MTAATYETCRACGSWQNTALLGDSCTHCGKPLDNVVAGQHQAVVPQKSSIVNRTVFRSASLRRAGEAKPL